MTTLTDFLLARIAEDDVAARAEVARRAGSPRRNGKAWAMRMVRECEAKRRILERFNGPPHDDEDCDEDCDGPDDHRAKVDAWGTLRDLASVHADHPDYRDEWRP